MANIHRSGEFGENWHRAGKLENKQNVFDDFIAAAAWLIVNQYTNPAKLLDLTVSFVELSNSTSGQINCIDFQIYNDKFRRSDISSGALIISIQMTFLIQGYSLDILRYSDTTLYPSKMANL